MYSKPSFSRQKAIPWNAWAREHNIGMNCEVKAGVHMNRSKNWSIIKRELLGLKWVGNTTSVGQRKITGRSNIAT